MRNGEPENRSIQQKRDSPSRSKGPPARRGCHFGLLPLAAMSALTIPEAFPILETKKTSRRPPLPDEEGFEDG